MSYTATALLSIAREELGYHEKATNANLDSKTASNDGSGNYTKYARDLRDAGYYNGNKNGYAWCDVFVDWCFFMLCGRDADKAQEIECQSGPYGAGCVWSAGYYKEAGRFHENGPQPGDQIFFGDFDHTGIVESVDGGILTTIEGNKDNMVKRCTYALTDSSIAGYGRPRYDAEPAPAAAPESVTYNAIDDLPDYAKPTIAKLVDKGCLCGTGTGLALSEDMVRIFVVHDRAGLYD